MICFSCRCFYLFKGDFGSIDQQSKAPKGQRQRSPHKTVTIKFGHTGSTESLFNNHPGNVHGCHSFPAPWKSFYYSQTLNSWTLHLGNYVCQWINLRDLNAIELSFSKSVHIWEFISVLYSYFPQYSSVIELTWQDKIIYEKMKSSCVTHGNRGHHHPFHERKRWDSWVEGSGMPPTTRLP